ncbi:hypothetical protein EDD36DRAFT_421338 [Exophiala viscosa]|uniref:Uncharacterized protein n=1 Tax=Exophiala viscosa TaxID=2486360 RepID=A0AAN6IAJ4_9EURO|nr:hypothetical protein EDD36DRAFT_421338 [Exophiala viscosa]
MKHGWKDPSLVVRQQDEQLHLLVLPPRKGLCTPYQLGKDDVFFRHECRSAITTLKGRRTAWNNASLKQVVRPGLSSVLTEKSTKFQRASDIGKVGVEPHKSFGKEIYNCAPTEETSTDATRTAGQPSGCDDVTKDSILTIAHKLARRRAVRCRVPIVAAFGHRKGTGILKELEHHLLKRAHMDPEYRTAPNYEGLVAFAKVELAWFTDEHAGIVMQEATQHWHSVQNMTPNCVSTLKRLVSENNKSRNTLGRRRLNLGMYRLSLAGKAGNIADPASVDDRMTNLEHTVAGSLSAPTTYALLKTVRMKLEEIVQVYQRFYDQLKGTFGESVIMFRQRYSSTRKPMFGRLARLAALRSVRNAK